jgi:hypothetical protein
MTAKKRATARESFMAPKLALFHALTTEQRAEWSDTRLAAHCGTSVWTIHRWIIRYPIAFRRVGHWRSDDWTRHGLKGRYISGNDDPVPQ